MRGVLRGAIAGTLAGIGLAGIYLLFGKGGNELTQFLAYSLVLIGFPAVFAVSPLLKWLGVDSGLSEYAGMVLLALPLNGGVWGACLGALFTRTIPPDLKDHDKTIVADRA